MKPDDATQNRDWRGLDPIADQLLGMYTAEGTETNRATETHLHALLMDSIFYDRSGQRTAEEVEHYLTNALAIVLTDLVLQRRIKRRVVTIDSHAACGGAA